MLLAFFNSDERIEDDILNRIKKHKNDRHFYRMIGILRTSGSEKSVNYFIDLLQANEFDSEKTKIILQIVQNIVNTKKIKRKTRRKFENYLDETQ